MQFQWSKTYLASEAYILPEKRLSSHEIEERLAPLYDRLKLPPGRLELMTGIKERRIAPSPYELEGRPSQMAIRAAQLLLNSLTDDIDLLIYCGVSRDFLEPATASVVHAGLNLGRNCPFFDLSNACLGVMQGWWMASELIEKGAIKNALVVAAENSHALVEQTINHLLTNPTVNRQTIKKALASLTIGSGAYASLLTSTISRTAPTSKKVQRLLGGSYLADSHSNHLCQGGNSGTEVLMETDSTALMQAGLELAVANWEEFKHSLSWTNSTPNHVITHQVGEAHHAELLKQLQIDKIASFTTFPFLGNTGSVALPITHAIAREDGHISSPCLTALLGIGSGLGSLMIGMSLE